MAILSATEPRAELEVIYADDTLLVLHKPPGLLSVPGRGEDKQDCLSARAQVRYPDASIVHRLDMSTSGLLLMARGGVAQRSLNAAFASRLIHKRYEAVVQGVVSMTEGISETAWQEINLPIFLDWPQRPKRMIDVERGQTSKTRWRALSSNSTAQTSRLLLEPITGRSHQLRVHLCAIAHPILGDTLYAPPEVAALSERLLLHATELTLVHPISQKTLHFESAAPF